MKSALTFYPTQICRNESLVESVRGCHEWAAELAQVAGEKSFVTMQHSLRDDEFALLIECGKKKFYAHAKDPKRVFDSVAKQVFKYIERLNAQQQKEEHSTRAKSR